MTMHKPTNNHSHAITAVAIYDGLIQNDRKRLWDIWSDTDAGGVELYGLCSQLAHLSEQVLADLIEASDPPFHFPGVYDYEVSELLGVWLYEQIVAHDVCSADMTDRMKLELGRLMVEFFSHDPAFSANPRNAEIIERHTGYKVA